MKRLLLFVVVSTLLTFGALAQNSASRLAPVSVHKSTKSERYDIIMENGKPIGFFDRVLQKRVNLAGEEVTLGKAVAKTKLSVVTKESAKTDVATVTLTVIGDPWGDGTGVQLLLDEDAEIVDNFWDWYFTDENLFYIHSEYKIPENASPTNNQVIHDGTGSVDIPGGIYDFIFFRPMWGMVFILNWAGTGEYAFGDDFLFLPGFEYIFTVETAGEVGFGTPEDITLSNIILPQPSLDLTSQEAVMVVLYNNGTENITGDIELAYKVNGGTEVIEIYTISELVPGAEITYTFNAKANFSAIGFHTVEARVEYEFDSNPYNNTITGKTKKLAIIELPFIDEFDTPESMLNWSTIDGNGDGVSWNYDDWFLTDADGGKGCLQVLCQTYGADEYLITDPIAIPEAGTYNMSFYAARLGNDNLKILYGTTFNVEEMEVLEVVTPNLNNWEKIELNVEIETPGNYFFAFHYYAVYSAGGAGINFDKFRLELPADIALADITLPWPSLDLTNQEVISVVLYNNGTVNITGDVELAYKVNGGTEIIEIYTISELAPGEETTYTFNAKADFSEVGFYTVEARVKYESDSNPYNNTITGKTKKPTLIELPFVDEFDTPNSMLNWFIIDGNKDGYSWEYDNVLLTDADGGKGCLQVLCQTYGADEYLITDPINMQVVCVTYTMSFYASRLGNDKITILYGTTSNVEEMEILEVVTPNLNDWEEIVLNLGAPDPGNYFFAFHYHAVHAEGGRGINFDKFKIEGHLGIPDIALSKDQLKLYPNPVSGVLNVELKNMDINKVIVTNTLGQVMHTTSNIKDTAFRLNTTGFAPGVYFISVQAEGGVVHSKFLVE